MQDQQGQPIAIMSNQVARARFDLTIQEQRVMIWLISQIKPGDTNLEPQVIYVHDFASLVGRSRQGSFYKEIEAISKSMLKKTIEIHVDGEARVRRVFQWLSEAEYHDKEGKIVLSLHPRLAPFVLDLQRKWAAISQYQAFQLRSLYAVRFYSCCVSWRSRGYWSMSVEELREWLHIRKGEFPRVANLRQRVLETARKELERKSDHYFRYKPIKSNRKVVGWLFNIFTRVSAHTSRSSNDEAGARAAGDARTPSPLDTLLSSIITDPPVETEREHKKGRATVDKGRAAVEVEAVVVTPPKATLDALAPGRERVTFEDWEAAIYQMFDHASGKIVCPLDDRERADLTRHMQCSSPEDIGYCLRYRALATGRSTSTGGRMVQHTQRRSNYIARLNEEIEKARQHFIKPGGKSRSFAYGPAARHDASRPASNDDASPAPVPSVVLPPNPVVKSMFTGLKTQIISGPAAPQNQFNLPGFSTSDEPLPVAVETTPAAS